MTAHCHLGGNNHEVGVWFEKKQTLVALIIKKLLSADGSALNEVRCSKWFFYAAGCDSATTSKTSKNAFNNKYLRIVKTWLL